MVPDVAKWLRPADERGDFSIPDLARSFNCGGCRSGVRYVSGFELTKCSSCGSSSVSGKCLKVEEHLKKYIEQLEEIIADATDLEISSLADSVKTNPAGLNLLSSEHYLKLRLTLSRAKYFRRVGDLKSAEELWADFHPHASNLCAKLEG